MKSKGSVSKKNYRKICAIVVIAEIFSCIALPAMASTRSNETTYTNTTVNTAGYYHNSSEDEIADKYAEIYDKNVAINNIVNTNILVVVAALTSSIYCCNDALL